MKIMTVTIFLLLSTINVSIAQTTSLIMESETGDYIGQGQSYNLTESDGTFTAIVNFDGGVRVSFNGTPGFFTIETAPKENAVSAYVPGPYPDATRFPFNSPTKPGFSAGGFGRGCNKSFSNFNVLEVEIDKFDVVLKFAATFEQHCENIDAPSLTGTIRYNSTGNMAVPDNDNDTVPNSIDNCIDIENLDQIDVDQDTLGNACDNEYTDTNIVLDSEEGDYIGQGLYQEFYLTDGNMTASRNFDNGVTINYQGEDTWTLNFAAAGDVDLSVGTYDLATRYPFQDVSEPGLSISGDGRGCNTLTGIFHVLTVEYDVLGEVEKFEVLFEQHCSDATPALFGRVNFNGNSEIIFKDGFD